jgi:hypothetical protein
MKEYVSPTGSPILGTKELLTGRAEITGIDDNGEPVYAGDTEIFYDDQVTETKDGKMIFLDEDGAEWTFDQLKPADEDDGGEHDGNDDDAWIQPDVEVIYRTTSGFVSLEYIGKVTTIMGDRAYVVTNDGPEFWAKKEYLAPRKPADKEDEDGDS